MKIENLASKSVTETFLKILLVSIFAQNSQNILQSILYQLVLLPLNLYINFFRFSYQKY